MEDFLSFPVLTTPRLLLRQLTINDASAIYAIRSNEEVNRHIGRVPAKNIGEAEYFIGKINEGISNGAWPYWGICFRENDVVIGTICLWNFSEEENKCEIGYELLPQFQGKGLMQEAIEAVLDFGFNKGKLKKIEAWTVGGNHGSIKLLEKNAFKRDTLAESKLDRNNEPVDSVIYSRTKN